MGKTPLYTSFLAHRLTVDHDPLYAYMCRFCSDSEFTRSIWQHYDTLATDGCTSSTSSARDFTSLISAFNLLVTSRPTLLRVSTQMHGVGVPASDSQSHLHSHSSDSIAEMLAKAASRTGMIGTRAGLSMKTAAITVQWFVSRSTFSRQAANFSPSFY
jgi:hypothetical protein